MTIDPNKLPEVLRNTNTFYGDAFNAEMMSIWGMTPFQHEVADLSYKRAITSWMRDNEAGEEDRRKMLYSFLKPSFAHDDAEDPLNYLFASFPSDNSFIKRAIRNLCIAYNKAPSRSFEMSKKEDFIDLLNKSKYDSLMQKVYRMAKLVNTVAVRPQLVKKQLRHIFLTPDLYRCKKDEYGDATEMWIPFQKIEQNNVINRFHVWNEKEYYQVDAEGKTVKFEFEGSKYTSLTNKYKRIPFEFLRMNEDTDVFGGSLWELCKSQLLCNKLDLMIEENLEYNGFSIWLLTNFKIKGKVKMSPGRVLTADDIQNREGADIPPTAETVGPTPQYLSIEELKERKMFATLKNLGLPSSVLENNPGLAASGVAMKADRMELDEIRKEDLAVLRPFDEQYANFTAEVMNIDLQSGYPTNFTVSINYSDLEIFLEPEDELDYLSSKARKGLIRPKDYYFQLTGDETVKTDEEAIKLMKKNKELFSQILEDENGEQQNESGFSDDSRDERADDNNQKQTSDFTTEGSNEGDNDRSAESGKNE